MISSRRICSLPRPPTSSRRSACLRWDHSRAMAFLRLREISCFRRLGFCSGWACWSSGSFGRLIAMFRMLAGDCWYFLSTSSAARACRARASSRTFRDRLSAARCFSACRAHRSVSAWAVASASVFGPYGSDRSFWSWSSLLRSLLLQAQGRQGWGRRGRRGVP